MSKSYDNTIPLWLPEKELRKAILGIVTNSQAPGESKNPDESNLFAIYQAFASADETVAMRRAYADGIGWGDAKQKVFERVNAELAPLREKYDALVADPVQIEDRLRAGAARARALATPFVARLREAVGLRSLIQSSAAPEQQKKARAEKPALQPVVFRDGNAFAFKVLDAKKAILAEKGGFADPKAAMAAAREAMDSLQG
jgi:tryptophanyl-tRNA synthetase